MTTRAPQPKTTTPRPAHEQPVALPTLTLAAGVAATTLAVAGLLALGVWFLAPAEAVDVAAGAGVVGLSALVALAVLRPGRKRPLSRWPAVWIGASFLRFGLTLAGGFLLYSATPYGSRAMWLGVVVAYLAVMVCETRIYAVAMKKVAPGPPPPSATE